MSAVATMKGSQLRVCEWINDAPLELEKHLEGWPSLAAFRSERALDWRAPLREHGFREVRDGLLRLAELEGLSPQAAGFWPKGGPVWDGVAVVHGQTLEHGVLLVEAKSHLAELESSPERRQRRAPRFDRALPRRGEDVPRRPPVDSLERSVLPVRQPPRVPLLPPSSPRAARSRLASVDLLRRRPLRTAGPRLPDYEGRLAARNRRSAKHASAARAPPAPSLRLSALPTSNSMSQALHGSGRVLWARSCSLGGLPRSVEAESVPSMFPWPVLGRQSRPKRTGEVAASPLKPEAL